jgi:phosphatidate cytidylyltransferase
VVCVKTRIVTAVCLLAVVGLGFVFEAMRWAPILLVMLLGVACVSELAAMAARRGVVMAPRLAMVAVVAMVYLGWRGRAMEAMLVLGLVAVLALAERLRRPALEGSWNDAAATIGAATYVGLPLALLTALLVQSDASRLWLLWLLAMVWTTDTMALFVGRAFGRAKMAPRISPGKTWEGAAGGLLGALVPGVIFRVLAPETFGGVGTIELLLVGLVFGTLTQVGDLVESLLKREAGVKDSGALLPGHGGALDRVDSILFVAVPFVCYLRVLHPTVF